MSAYHIPDDQMRAHTTAPGRPLLRYQRYAQHYAAQYCAALDAALDALSALLARTPTFTELTGDQSVPLAERDVVWALVCRTSSELARQRVALREMHAGLPVVVAAVNRIPTEWSADDSRRFFDRPQLWGMTSEDTEDILTERAQGGLFAQDPTLD